MQRWRVAVPVTEVATALQARPAGKHALTWQSPTPSGHIYFMLFEEFQMLPGGWCILAVKLVGNTENTDVEELDYQFPLEE